MQKRKAVGITQEKLSEEMGISKNHISSIERGKNIPTTQFIFKLCNVLGETPDYYLIGKITIEVDEIVQLIKSMPNSTQKLILELIKTYLDYSSREI